jgi:hypothetical protein
MSVTAMADLDEALDSVEMDVMLAAAWSAFSVARQLANDVVWLDGSDDLQAIFAAQACSTDRSMLPPPEWGWPVKPTTPGPGAAALVPYIELLRHTDRALIRLADDDEVSGTGVPVLREIAGHARRAAEALAAVRK